MARIVHLFLVFILLVLLINMGELIYTFVVFSQLAYCICGAREFVTPAHFTLGPKARAEERHCRGHTTKVQMA